MGSNTATQYLLRIISLLVLLSYSHGDDGSCIWYGNCGRNPANGKCLNCYRNDTKPSTLSAEAKEMLFEACPHFREDPNVCDQKDPNNCNPKVCCTKRQIESMGGKEGFALAKQFLNNCPTCYLNWRKNFCASTCSPVQNKFLRISKANGELTIRNGKMEPCGSFSTIDPGIPYFYNTII